MANTTAAHKQTRDPISERRQATVWPVWTPMLRRPWRLAWQDTGERVRRPREGRTHRAYTFPTAQAACDFARRHGLELEANPQNGTRVMTSV